MNRPRRAAAIRVCNTLFGIQASDTSGDGAVESSSEEEMEDEVLRASEEEDESNNSEDEVLALPALGLQQMISKRRHGVYSNIHALVSILPQTYYENQRGQQEQHSPNVAKAQGKPSSCSLMKK